MNPRLVRAVSIDYKIKHAFAKCFLCHMDHKVTLVGIVCCKVNLIPLAGLAEVNNVGQIFFRRRHDIAVRRSKRVQLRIFLILYLSALLKMHQMF